MPSADYRLNMSFPMRKSLVLVFLVSLLSADPGITQEANPSGIYPISVQGPDYQGEGISWLINLV